VSSPETLWRHPPFRTLWLGIAGSDFGSAITVVALPLTAIVTLGAGAVEMGLLVAVGQAPVPLFGLFTGVWVDRVRRRPLMIAAEWGRALLLASIPAAALFDSLSLAQLYVVAFAQGTLAVIFDLGVTSYLPTLIPAERLLDGNAKLQMTHQVSAVTGRGVGGALVQALTAPLAIAVDAVTFAFSAVCFAFIRTPERAPSPAGERAGMGREIAEGMRATFGQPVIAAMTITSTLGAMGGALQQSVFFLFMSQELELAPRAIGAVVGSTALGAWFGARYAAPLAQRVGPGPALIVASTISMLGYALVPLAGLGPRVMGTLVLSQLLAGGALTLFSVNQISLRQRLTPDALLGRVNATRRVFVFGSIPIGALAGGFLGEALGLRTALVAGACMIALSLLYALASPLRTLRRSPTGA
jgi:MFS family permease